MFIVVFDISCVFLVRVKVKKDGADDIYGDYAIRDM